MLGASPEAVRQKGEIEGIFSKTRAPHIAINKTHYVQAGEEESGAETTVYEIDPDGGSALEIATKEETQPATPFEAGILEEIRRVAETGEDYREIFRRVVQAVHEEVEQATGELRKEVKTVTFEKKRTESVIQGISEGLVVVDEKGKVLLMNPAAEKILDCKKDEKIGTSLLEGLTEGHVVSLSGALNEESEQKIKEIHIGGGQETMKTVRSSMAVVQNEDGKTIGMAAILSDITKQKELGRMKSEFLSKVTHELRTPFAAIKQTIAMILEGTAGPLTKTQNDFLGIAKKNIERLSGLINDVLDLSKLEAKKMEVHKEAAQVDDVMNEVQTTFDSWASKKGITLACNSPPALPPAPFDFDKVTQVLTNLVSNALKFTPQGGRIALSAEQTADNRFIQVSVNDTGPGIAKESLDRVFDKFVQVRDSGREEIRGTGLGLSIAKEIIELHNGKIWAESPVEQGKGSRFIFTLPLERAEQAPPARAAV